ncbi:riboflavin biosynthesis protein RibD [Lactobacillus xylocopicola]|uniref:Riboflavin biosynthesis protein RibD n=1 Tax=Lactobacillus xylocopicola TaxID=2976676 RepID=A0ABM8BFI1_9LACO|nr:bifunctional diaminohydroxyphosphoribosylaminopyrimidine deaminase/5-amino-6-(5-phosphoribosylamino)uracil reductase RibD [Lactobacillus xylocopicola]BDR59970.1 riboflavin biosynthesis protein RibD [Lactobacillus xylocopicola]
MQDKDYMRMAVKEAVKAQGMTWTNPLVGAVIVKDGQVLATGYHHQYGREHAEVNALLHLTKFEEARGATLYVTLEPCSHYGKQPPCCKKVAAAGIKRVIIGQVDPHEVVGGKGIKYLNEHNVETEVIGGTEYLNEAYNFFYRQQRPLVTMKYAMSLDGKLNEAGNKRTMLTGEAAQDDVQQLRLRNQAILVGANTVRVDDPLLTVRIRPLPQLPIRIVLTRDANRLDLTKKIFKTPGPIWLLSQTELTERHEENVRCFTAEKWTPAKIVQLLTDHNLQSLLVEGGSNVQAQFIAAALADEVVAYIAPTLLGGSALPVAMGQEASQKVHYQVCDVQTLGPDVRLRARRE